GGVGGGRGFAFGVGRWVPVVHVTAIEAVEIVEAEPICPTVKGTGRARLPNRRVVVLTDPGGHVSVLSQDFADRACATRQHRGVAVISSSRLADYAGGRRVVVAPSNKRSACPTGQGRRMEAVVAQALCREPVHRWRRYAAAARTELAEASAVDQNEHDVRRTLGCLYRLRELRRV